MDRRTYLASAAGGLVGLAGLAGCLGGRPGGGTDGDGADGAADGDGATLPPPVAGDPDADVTVAVYEDYACPHCMRYATAVVPTLREEYLRPGTVRYEWHDFPIPVDERWSWQAASAARAVQDGVDDAAFFAFTKRLFAEGWSGGRADYSLSFFRRAAEAVGADPETVATAAEEERYRQTVSADREAGIDRGVEATPTVFVDGEAVSGYDYESVRAAIEGALGE